VSAFASRGAESSSGNAGPPADITYVRGQITGHRKALDLYERQPPFGTDQGLVSLAERTILTLKDHLKQATRLSRAVRRGRGNDGNDTTTTTTLPATVAGRTTTTAAAGRPIGAAAPTELSRARSLGGAFEDRRRRD